MLYTRPNNLAHARLGVVVAKRLAPRAVTRNMIKRLARELFRKAALPPVDCIIRLTKPVGTRVQSASSREKSDALAPSYRACFCRNASVKLHESGVAYLVTRVSNWHQPVVGTTLPLLSELLGLCP